MKFYASFLKNKNKKWKMLICFPHLVANFMFLIDDSYIGIKQNLSRKGVTNFKKKFEKNEVFSFPLKLNLYKISDASL